MDKLAQIDSKESVQARPLVRSMRDEDGAVLLDLKGGKYYSLNGIGAEIWSRVEQGEDLGTLREALEKSYRVDPEVLSRDLDCFLDSLESSGLIVREEAGKKRVRR